MPNTIRTPKIKFRGASARYLLAQWAWRLGQCRIPWVKNALIRGFVRWYGLDEPAGMRAYACYENFNAFFARRSRPTQVTHAHPDALVAPVDGVICALGELSEDRLLQVKGSPFSVHDLIPHNELSRVFRNGLYLTYYLSPRDYHRVHMPVDGTLLESSYQPGGLYSVHPNYLFKIHGLYCRNERVCCLFQTEYGLMAVVLVGAFLVGGIETVWHGRYTPPHGQSAFRQKESALAFKRGEEMGRFFMGSSVLVLLEPGAWQLDKNLRPGDRIELGTPVAQLYTQRVLQKR